MAEIPDIISAIEGYLEKNGNGPTYLASKITALFEDSESPLNLKGKYLQNLANTLNVATKKLQKFDLSEIVAASKLFSYKLTNLFSNIQLATTNNANPILNPRPNTSAAIPQNYSSNVSDKLFEDINEALHHMNNFMSEFRFEILGKFFDNLESANGIFQDMKVPFHSVDVIANSDIRAALPEYSEWPTFPQVFINGKLVGGCDIVHEMYESGELQKLL